MILTVERSPAVSLHVSRPHRRIDGMARRAERQKWKEHGLVEAAPVVGQVPALRTPAERDQRWPRLSPAPVDAAVNRLGELANVAFDGLVANEVRLTEE